MPHEPVLAVLLVSSLAAALAGVGSIPYFLPRPPSKGLVGAAYALASGLMLGAGYLLMSRGLDLAVFSVVAGSGVGVAYTHWIRSYAGIDELDTFAGEVPAPELGYKILLQNMLHSAAEGVAIGVAMVLDIRLGVFLALALAVHNVAEAMALTDILRGLGMGVAQSAGLCVASNVGQPLLALAAFALSPVLGGLLPAALGFSAGCLVFLTLTELLPSSYQRAKHGQVGLLVSLASGAVVFLEHFFVRAQG